MAQQAGELDEWIFHQRVVRGYATSSSLLRDLPALGEGLMQRRKRMRAQSRGEQQVSRRLKGFKEGGMR
jgi:hypothetical protein